MQKIIDKIKLLFNSIVDWFKKYKCWCLVGLLSILLVLVLFIYATEDAPFNPPKIFSWKIGNSVSLGKEVSLGVRQSLIIDSESLEVKFLGVVSDSRCPKGVNCFSAGQAIVMIKVFKSGEDLGNFKLIDTNDAKGHSTQVDVYKISLLKVEPYPEVNKNINSDDYRITIRVDKI